MILKGVPALLIGMAAAAACRSPLDVPDNAAPFTPPSIYARWWTMTEACAGRTGSFNAVGWYRVPGGVFERKGTQVGGYYSPSRNVIVLSDTLATNSAEVRHMMLHSLVGGTGHSRAQFLESCAGIVDCAKECAADAGKWTAPAAFVPLAADSLTISTVVQLLPNEFDSQRYLSLKVRARNPRTAPIVAVPFGSPFGFGFDLRGTVVGTTTFSLAIADSSNLYFAAGQTKEWLFEFRVDAQRTRYTIQKDNYLVSGAFGQHWANYTSVTVIP